MNNDKLFEKCANYVLANKFNEVLVLTYLLVKSSNNEIDAISAIQAFAATVLRNYIEETEVDLKDQLFSKVIIKGNDNAD